MTPERAAWLITHLIMGEIQFAFDNPWDSALWESNTLPTPRVQTYASGITREEHSYVLMVWSLMGPNKSYFDALKAIAGRN